jgi:protein-disulfide isomerase
VRLLLDRKSDLNAANRNDITPLIAAAQTGDADAVRLLLQAGAAADRLDNLGWTALMWARNRGREDIARLLLEHGADAAKGKVTAPVEAARTRPRVSPAVDATRIVRGDAKAPITIYEYTDFQCPYCAHGARILDEVMARYEGRVRLVVKHLPLPLLHPMAMSCARYFEALSLQDAAKAWAFYDRVFADRAALAGGDAYLRRLAADLGADLEKLGRDLDGPTVRDRIAADLEESRQFRFDGVPAFVVDGEVIEGAQPAKRFDAAIDVAQRR